MSWGNDRTEIVTALNTVSGVKAYVNRPTALKPGDAWPLLPSLDLQDGLCWRPTWTVLVVLPQDEQAAAEWLDSHFEAIVTALRVPAFAESAEPIDFQTSGGSMLVLAITLRSE